MDLELIKLRNRLYRHFIKEVNGKGRARIDGICAYAVQNHPGCAIGCQPEFQFICTTYGINRETLAGSVNSEGSGVIAALCREAFGDNVEYNFLRSLQMLHDSPLSWSGLFLTETALSNFESQWGVSRSDS